MLGPLAALYIRTMASSPTDAHKFDDGDAKFVCRIIQAIMQMDGRGNDEQRRPSI